MSRNFVIEISTAQLKKDYAVGLGYDWNEVFKYAVAPESLDGQASRETFTILEVKKVIASVYGEADGEDWLMVGRLADDRFFSINAGCDYTGWD